MKRFDIIDILKGIAVIFMITFHVFYFPNQYGFKEIKYDTKPLYICSKIEQYIFIICVGINLSITKLSSKENINKEEFNQKSIQRILKIALLALFMTLFSWFIFGDKYIKFGILHFIAIISLILFNYADNTKLIQILLILSIIINYLIKHSPNLFQNVPEKLAFILGFYNKKYTSVDHFPIFPWIIFIFIGMIIGNKIVHINEPEYNNIVLNTLKGIGKKSLKIYVVHWIILYIVYCHLYQKFCRLKL